MTKVFMRGTSLILVGLLVLMPLSAQQPQAKPGDFPWVSRLITQLKLSDEQASRVRQIASEHQPKIEALLRDRINAADKAGIDREIAMEQTRIKQEIMPILSPQQLVMIQNISLNNPQPGQQGNKRPNIPMPTGPALSTLDATVKLSSGKILTPDQKILHLLNRITFGPRPGDIAMVKHVGIENFIDLQLHPDRIDDKDLQAHLADFETLDMSSQELIAYAPPPQLLARAQQIRAEQDGQMMDIADPNQPDQKSIERLRQQTNRANTELPRAKMLRAIYSEKQLQEIMVDFWFNHFNVFIGKNNERYLLLPYERDVIRPNAMGKFKDLLLATAQSPAMMDYLDNWQSISPDAKPPRQPFPELGRIYNPLAPAQRKPAANTNQPVKNNTPVPAPENKKDLGANAADNQQMPANRSQSAANQTQPNQNQPKPPNANPQRPNRPRYGINENYARELMELHTLGVDGGYTQQDVIEVAKCFTGWTMQQPPLGSLFIYKAWAHDNGEKTVLGHKIAAGGGMADGLQVIDILAHHPSTAHFVAFKLCQRFVSDNPGDAIVNKVAQTFTKTDGDIRECLKTIFTAPEFYTPETFRSKFKSPLEFVASTIRATGAYTDGQVPVQLMNQLGEGLYQQQFPTGYPEDSSKWTNTGALLARMNQSVRISNNGANGTWIDIEHLVPADSVKDASMLVDEAIKLLIHTDIAESEKGVLIKQATEMANDQKKNALLTTTIALVLGSPDFQRR